MTFSEAKKLYSEVAGDDYRAPNEARSYCRNSAWHLLNRDGALVAAVHADGSVTHGSMLLRVILAEPTWA
jgi:hypothetical protein